MVRGVSQLLFNYLPGRTVDWEDGLAIVVLEDVILSSVWPEDRCTVVLDEVAQLLDRWRSLGGSVDPEFPDPRTSPGRFSVGTPESINATVLDTAYVCQACGALEFPSRRALGAGDRSLHCRHCNSGRIRQFGQVFVHGCGEFHGLTEFTPWARQRDGRLEPSRIPLRCQTCGDRGVLAIPSRSERVRDMSVVCRTCGRVVRDRLNARCRRCTRRISAEERGASSESDASPIARVAMRMSRYSANDTYYAQSVTLLRLDRPALGGTADPTVALLQELLPSTEQARRSRGASIAAIGELIRQAEASGDKALAAELLERVAQLAGTPETEQRPAQGSRPEPPPLQDDVRKAVRESLAFATTVNRSPALALSSGSPSQELMPDRARTLQRRLGLSEVSLVRDLPVISATYGYTRRAFQPTYEELNVTSLPTEIRPFPALSDYAAGSRLGRQELVGTQPILAREGEHEGVFLSLDAERVVRWLSANGIDLPATAVHADPLPGLLRALEPIDRYYDGIWGCPVRRLVFGLVHSLSHSAMRAASWFAGLERTSLSEYVFLPLLGTVVFDTSGSFQLGGLETLARDHLAAFLEALREDALTCIYDGECIDARGACHGCIHSPEIACRVFNHGLSRAFLVGGHAPWADISTDERVIGYWELDT